jgi:hypothetical protein
MRNRARVVAGACGAWLMLVGAGGASAGPPATEGAPAQGAGAPEASPPGDAAAPTGDAAAPATDAAAQALPPTANVSVAAVNRDMETDMAALGDIASDAKRDTDLVRAACVLDKQERAQGVMELATGELLVIRDAAATAEARSFAVEKLQAAASRLDDLVQQAKDCVGDQSPDMSDDETENDVENTPLIPIADPTVGGGVGGSKPPGMPPPVDDGAPPTVGSPSM